MQNSRIDAPEDRSATCSIRSRNVSSPHWMSSKTTTSGRSAAACSSVLRNAQAISSADVAASVSPSSERIATAAASSEGRTSSCFSTSTTGQYVIPSPYGRQRPRTTVASIDASSSAASRDLPTPASPTTVTSSHRCSARTRSHASRRIASSRVTADEQRLVPALRRVAHAAAADRREPGRPCPSARAARPARPPTASRTSASVGCPISTSPGCAACSSRAATLTASPVASRSSRPRHHLAGHDADPPLQAQLGQRVAHLDRRPHRAQRVVLVQHRHAEHGHHRVADELLHAAAVPLHDRLHPLEVAREQRTQPLGIERLAERRRARSGRRTAPSPSCAAPASRAGAAGEREAALLAELGALAVLVPTTRADQHEPTLEPFGTQDKAAGTESAVMSM